MMERREDVAGVTGNDLYDFGNLVGQGLFVRIDCNIIMNVLMDILNLQLL